MEGGLYRRGGDRGREESGRVRCERSKYIGPQRTGCVVILSLLSMFLIVLVWY
jgi:hypothetical protein